MNLMMALFSQVVLVLSVCSDTSTEHSSGSAADGALISSHLVPPFPHMLFVDSFGMVGSFSFAGAPGSASIRFLLLIVEEFFVACYR